MNESVPWDTSCRRCALGSLAVFLVLSALPALGQSVPATEVETEATAAVVPSAVAVAVIGTGPVLDGDVLGDPAWIDVPVATGFIQTQPDEGQPATERTELRVLFDDDTIYFGFVCYDRDPDGIITSEGRRDTSTDGQRFLVIATGASENDRQGRAEINVVLNWFEELKERVPVP